MHDPTDTPITINVEAASQNTRVDLFIKSHLPDISRVHVQNLITEHQVCVNNHFVKANYKVQEHDVITIHFPKTQSAEIQPEEIPLSILYEDTDIIVINKSRGMVVHPAVGNIKGTLVNALLHHCHDLSGINGIARPGIVHRLDKDTSGVMVVAKNDRAHIHLAQQIKERHASRIYIAIVHGNIKEDSGIIDAPIGRHPVDRKKMAVVFQNSKKALTNFKVLERFGEYTMIECKLATGRTHQIRVHLAYIGHPVVGDPQYGPERNRFAINGQALHSRHLTLQHPISGNTMDFIAPIPEDMQNLLKILKRHQ